MDFKKLTQRARKMVDDRGGTDALKQDLEELKGIAKGEGSVADKAKAAAAALKEPGGAAKQDEGEGPARHGDPATGSPARPAEPDVHPGRPPAVSSPDAPPHPDPEQPDAARAPRNPA